MNISTGFPNLSSLTNNTIINVQSFVSSRIKYQSPIKDEL